MTTFRPYPGDVVADTADAVFWQACREERYLVSRCSDCDRHLWPAGACPDHGMAGMTWVEASGRGRLVSWTVVHQDYPSSFRGAPDTTAVIELEEGAFVHSALSCRGRPSVGMAVEVAFHQIGDGVVIPVFCTVGDDTVRDHRPPGVPPPGPTGEGVREP
ncbi:Zn-ribbon domain-containing OB-fold protein [Pseudonocardia pini]|uniref:Zn-ribbon domain-containing OB-fold protein n=1 Tax=Pseudonocardia pini TaxID=2758030 RepID=UPI0015F0FB85|nr:OB-fold domain-containing protein [Pseudonocardia pini]